MSTAGSARAPCRASDSCCPTVGADAASTARADDPVRRARPAHGPLPAAGDGGRVASASASSERATTPPRCCCPTCATTTEVELVSVATTKSLSGLNAQRKFGFATITTNVEAVLDDDTLDAVFIVTRHHSHAGLVCQALERGLSRLRGEAARPHRGAARPGPGHGCSGPATTGSWSASTGGSHRCSPICETASAASGPGVRAVSVNAGRLDPSSWYLNEELEGSRFAGEGGHFIDTLSALVGQDPVEVHAMGTGANVHATLRFADESVATISYLTDGSPRFPKETLDVIGDGRIGRLDNFQRVTVWSSKGKNGRRVLAGQDKGQRRS